MYLRYYQKGEVMDTTSAKEHLVILIFTYLQFTRVPKWMHAQMPRSPIFDEHNNSSDPTPRREGNWD